jgi:hypothetical protein
MSNSIGPCPTELDTLDSNIWGQDQDGLRATGLIQRHQAACLDHNCTLQQETTATATGVRCNHIHMLLSNSIGPCPIGDGPLSEKNQKWYLIPLKYQYHSQSGHVIKSESIESRLSPDSLDSVWPQWTQLLLESCPALRLRLRSRPATWLRSCLLPMVALHPACPLSRFSRR